MEFSDVLKLHRPAQGHIQNMNGTVLHCYIISHFSVSCDL